MNKEEKEAKQKILAHIKEIQIKVRKLNSQIKVQMNEKKYKEAKRTISETKKELMNLKSIIEDSPDKYFFSIAKNIKMIMLITSAVSAIFINGALKERRAQKKKIIEYKNEIRMMNGSRKGYLHGRKTIEKENDAKNKENDELNERRQKVIKELEPGEKRFNVVNKTMKAKDKEFQKAIDENKINPDKVTLEDLDKLLAEYKKLNDDLQSVYEEIEPLYDEEKKLLENIIKNASDMKANEITMLVARDTQSKKAENIKNKIKELREYQKNTAVSNKKSSKKRIAMGVGTAVVANALPQLAKLRKTKSALLKQINKQIAHLTKLEVQIAKMT